MNELIDISDVLKSDIILKKDDIRYITCQIYGKKYKIVDDIMHMSSVYRHSDYRVMLSEILDIINKYENIGDKYMYQIDILNNSQYSKINTTLTNSRDVFVLTGKRFHEIFDVPILKTGDNVVDTIGYKIRHIVFTNDFVLKHEIRNTKYTRDFLKKYYGKDFYNKYNDYLDIQEKKID